MHPQRWLLITALVLATGYVWLSGSFVGMTSMDAQGGTAVQGPEKPGLAVATFAAGCFWCTEADFDKVAGVVSTTSGYTGGTVANPAYRQVTSGQTGHAEAVQVVFDPAVVSYEALLDHYWKNVDPFVAHRQFCDVGNQYRRFSITTRHSGLQRTSRRLECRRYIASRSWSRSHLPGRSIGRKNITRTTTRRTPRSTGSIDSGAAAIAALRRSRQPPVRDCKEITACTVDRRVVRCARGVGHPAGKACSAGARAHGAIAPGVGGD